MAQHHYVTGYDSDEILDGMRGTFTVRFRTDIDMTVDEFIGQLDSMCDFTIIESYEVVED